MSEPVSDRGAQPERTALAWQRTSLAVIAACAAVLRLAAVRGSAVGSAVALTAALLALVTLLRVNLGYRRSALEVEADLGTVAMGPAAATAAAVALLGVSTLAVALT